LARRAADTPLYEGRLGTGAVSTFIHLTENSGSRVIVATTDFNACSE
jgi:hypothetical protein